MKIEANDKEVQDIFSLGYFNIPRFQRPYSWGLDEVESFWNDAIQENPENYFIGSMVVYQTKKPYFGIVDGQQRLSTITLILSGVRNAFLHLGEKDLAKGVHKYIEKANIDNENEFVLKTETSFPYLQDHIQAFNGFDIVCDVGVEEQKLKNAFELISEKLKTLIPEIRVIESTQATLFANHELTAVQKLKEIRDKVLALKLVFIQLDNEDDAYLIFETLNARGRDLTTADLVKNLLLKKIKSKSASLDQAKESWNSLVRKFDEINDPRILDIFLLHYWNSEHAYTTDKKLFSEVKSFVSDDSLKAKELIKRLSSSAKIYCRIYEPELYNWTKDEEKIRNILMSFKKFKVKQQSSMVLSLARAYYEKRITLKNLTKALSKIELFHYCFNAITSQRSSGSIATNYSKLAINLSNARHNNDVQIVFNELNAFLKSRLPEEKEFIVKFSELFYLSNKTKYKNIIKYSLMYLLPKSNNGMPIDLNSLTIEHILPESSIKNGISEEAVGSIGNLLLIDKKTNSEDLKDINPDGKFSILKDIEYPLKESLVNTTEWNEETIRNRTELMSKLIYNQLRKEIHT